MDPEFHLWWDAELSLWASNVSHPSGLMVGILPLMFTHAILLYSPEWQEERWCYHSHDDALLALLKWNPFTQAEPEGWHRHPTSGRRRPNGDKEKEYVNE